MATSSRSIPKSELALTERTDARRLQPRFHQETSTKAASTVAELVCKLESVYSFNMSYHFYSRYPVKTFLGGNEISIEFYERDPNGCYWLRACPVGHFDKSLCSCSACESTKLVWTSDSAPANDKMGVCVGAKSADGVPTKVCFGDDDNDYNFYYELDLATNCYSKKTCPAGTAYFNVPACTCQ